MEKAGHHTIEVFYTEFPTKLSDPLWSAYLNCLPGDLRGKNQKYRRWQDQHANLFGKLLLVLALQKYGLGREILEQLRYTSHYRPFISQNIDFNISHSGRYVLCAVGINMKIGVDIEEIKPVGFENFDAVMSGKQWFEIKKADDSMRKFYDYWTIKESVIKADGRGVTIPLETLSWKENVCVYDGNEWNIHSFSIDSEYASHLATNLPTLLIKLKRIDFYDDKHLHRWQQ